MRMSPRSKSQLEMQAEGLLHLQSRLNDLTIRLYKAVRLEDKMFMAPEPKASVRTEDFVESIIPK